MDYNSESGGRILNQVLCPECGHAIPVLISSDELYYGCSGCDIFFIKKENGWHEVLKRFKSDDRYEPVLPPGSTGVIEDVEWTVTAFMRKSEIEDGVAIKWSEYVLHKAGEFATMVEMNGHWMFVRYLNQNFDVVKVSEEVYVTEYDNLQFELYHSYNFNVAYAYGAFDEDLRNLKNMHTWEYINPPCMLVNEVMNKKSEWFLGRYMDSDEVALLFSVQRGMMPGKVGVGLIEPSPFEARRKLIYSITTVLFVLLLGVVLYLTFTRQNKELLSSRFSTEKDTTGAVGSRRIIVSPSFNIDARGPVELTFRSSLQNEWIEISASLVNESSGASYEFSKALEFYSGVDEGESWSEGSQEGTVFLSAIPAGRYHLNISPLQGNDNPADFEVQVVRKDWIGSNAIFMILLIAGLPGLNYFFGSRFEQKRMSNA